MMIVIVPLWLVTLQPSGLMIGLMIGARSLMAILFSIPGGALMDRIGPRRVIVGFAILGVATTPLYPLMPWVMAVMLLQVLNGFSETTVWNGVQTLMGQFMKGDHEFAGRPGHRPRDLRLRPGRRAAADDLDDFESDG